MRIDRRDPTWKGHLPLGPALLVVTGAAMLAWTWRAWPDPVVDFGRELYVPWRLSQGESLFTDIAWFNGPLSQYWNAALFRIFGPGLSVLALANILVLAGCVWMLYGLIAGLADRATATVAAMMFLLVFAFGQYVGIANTNWITPYSHELTHGVTLGLASFVALARWRRTGSSMAVVLGGLALGLCFLTKVEPFLAGAAACLVLLASAVRERDLRVLVMFAGAAALPVVLSLWVVGWRGTLGAWPPVLAGEVAQLPFYRAEMGLDAPALRLEELLRWSGIWLLAIGIPVGVAWLGRGTRGRLLPLASAGASLVLLWATSSGAWRPNALRPLPLAAAVIAGGFVVARRRGVHDARATTATAFAVFSLVLLAKMLLRARVAHYGFALAMPATLLVVSALVGWVPTLLDARGLRGAAARACTIALLAFFAIEHLSATSMWLGRKSVLVGTGRDRFRSDVRGVLVQRAVDGLTTSGARSAAVLPEGAMINYLARVPNPTPYLTFMPPEAILFGDQAWVDAFRGSPPDVILIVPKDTSEYGRGPFGVGYGNALADWVSAHYVAESAMRIRGVPFEIRIMVPR